MQDHADTPRPIQPARREIDVSLRLPGSKSITNRALLLAALADGESVVRGALDAADTRAFAGGLVDLGFAVETGAEAWRVHGGGGRIPAASAAVCCAEAGTAARFLLAAAATGHGEYRFDAAAQLRRRPLSPLLDALRNQGAATEPEAAASLPLTLHASGLAGGALRLPGETSSQFISALLMAAPLGRAALELTVDGLVSRPYVRMTTTMMERFGVAVESRGDAAFRVRHGVYRAREFAVEPDASTASYFFAAAAATGGTVRVEGLRRHGCLQGDIRFLDILAAMGCDVRDDAEGVSVTGPAALAGITVDMSDISDTFMTLAAIAPLAASPVTVTGIANVRLKESDRIAAMEANLGKLGVRTESGPDRLRVFPSLPHGAHIDPRDDHRVAMSFAVLGLRVPDIVIDDPGCVAKTCPDFFTLWRVFEQGTV